MKYWFLYYSLDAVLLGFGATLAAKQDLEGHD